MQRYVSSSGNDFVFWRQERHIYILLKQSVTFSSVLLAWIWVSHVPRPEYPSAVVALVFKDDRCFGCFRPSHLGFFNSNVAKVFLFEINYFIKLFIIYFLSWKKKKAEAHAVSIIVDICRLQKLLNTWTIVIKLLHLGSQHYIARLYKLLTAYAINLHLFNQFYTLPFHTKMNLILIFWGVTLSLKRMFM